MAVNRIKGITVEIGGDTTKLTDALKDVNKSIKDTQSELKDLDKLLKLDPGNAELLSQKQKDLAKAISDTKDKLKSEQEALRQLQNGPQTEETTKQQEALAREIEDTKEKLKSLTDEYKNFGSVAGSQLQAAGEKMKDVGNKISDVGSSVTKKVTVPLAAVGAVGAVNFADVDKTMQLANKTMGNTAEEAGMVSSAMKDAAANSTYGMSDAANAVLNFARAGLKAEDASNALAPAMNLAAGEGGDLDTVSAGLVSTINGFHGSFADAGTYADIFASACNNSALDVNSLSSAMSVAAPIFSSAGYSVKHAALYMGIMANNGIDADKAANSLKTGIAKLISPAKDGADMMEKLGISVTNSDGSMKDSVQIQRELHDAFGKLSESEKVAAASAIFGKNQMAPWLALIGTAPSDVDQLNNSLGNCSGTTKEMADTMMSGFGGSIEQLKSSVDVLTYSLGETLAPVLQKVVDFAQGIVDKLNSMDPQTRKAIVTAGLIVAAIGPVLVIVGKVITATGTIVGGIGKLMSVGSALSSGISLLGSASLLPMIAIIAAVVAAIVGIILVIKNWNAISKKVSEVWKGIKTTLGGIWDGLKSKATSVFDGMKTKIAGTWDAIKQKAGAVWKSIKTAITKPVEDARDSVKRAIEKMKGFFHFSWSLPKIKMPHFKITGSFSLNPPRVPHFGVSWYKKAMDEAYILNRPTIFGAAGGKLLGGGEAGAEAVVGTDKLKDIVKTAVAGVVGTGGDQTIVIPVYIGQERIDELVVKAAQRNNYRSGGR